MYFCSLSSGSSGNCMYIGSEKTSILIDVGISRKVAVEGLRLIKVNPSLINGILVTHEHLDHYKGVNILAKTFDIPVYLNESTYNIIKDKISDVKSIKIIEDDKFSIGDLDIETFKLPHDAADPIGYSVLNGGKKISIATDIGHVSKDLYENLKDSNLILLESNYNEQMVKMGDYPYFLKQRILSKYGHLSNEDCGSLIVKLLENFPKKIILGHLSNTNNLPELAYKTVEKILISNNLKVGEDLGLTVAHRNLPSNYMRV